jgi:CubicO group peptidase (beta-lactamase class C family)
MPHTPDLLRDFDGKIQQILQNGLTSQGSIYVERVGESKQHGTFYNSEGENNSRDSNNDDSTIYCIASITKILIALLLSIIVDGLSLSQELKHRRYRALRKFATDPWKTSFTSLFNCFSKTKIALLPQDPTLLQVLLHFNSLPPITHILLGPDGTSLMSRESFLRVAPRLANDAYGNSQENRLVYNNSGYILIGIFIEAVSGDMLESVMQEYLFSPLKMERSFLGTPDCTVTGIASPYTTSVNGPLPLAYAQLYPVGNIMNAALGAWSCCRDLAILFRALQACIDGDPSIFNQESIRHLFKPQAKPNQKLEDGFTICGICTTLDSPTVGSKSINRLISPNNICSTYRLGTRPNGKQIPAYYFAGHIEGYSSCFYFMPRHKSFVIVLTSSTGRTDSSDHISRLLLQEMFDLERSQKGLVPTRKHNCTKQVDVVEMSRLVAIEGQNLLEKFAAQDAKQDAKGISPIRLQGVYLNEKTEHKIVIEAGGKLVRIVGTAQVATGSAFIETGAMGIIRTGNETIRLRPLSQVGFTIDRLDPYSWNNLTLSLTVGQDKNGNPAALCLERHTDLFVDKFMRQ